MKCTSGWSERNWHGALWALLLLSSRTSACTSNQDCSLNGVCAGSACVCDAPWKGPACGVLGFATTPAVAKDAYPSDPSDWHNTWNGPIVRDAAGKFHMYLPLYAVGQLFGAHDVKHGLADSVSGPYNWGALPDITDGAINPAFLVYNDASDGNKTVYSIWMQHYVLVSDRPDGNFTRIPHFTFPSSNPAPLWHDGAFYLTNQHTEKVWTLPGSTLRAGLEWHVHGNISHASVPDGTVPEDPFMWVDKRNNWHIVNHAYDVSQLHHCARSAISTHFFSADGKDWHLLSGVEPYGHVVHFDDGTNHTYTTLERPFLYFDVHGQMTHLSLAADLITGDEGCANRTGKHAGTNGTACTNCKYGDRAGTLVVTLDV